MANIHCGDDQPGRMFAWCHSAATRRLSCHDCTTLESSLSSHRRTERNNECFRLAWPPWSRHGDSSSVLRCGDYTVPGGGAAAAVRRMQNEHLALPGRFNEIQKRIGLQSLLISLHLPSCRDGGQRGTNSNKHCTHCLGGCLVFVVVILFTVVNFTAASIALAPQLH